LETKILWIDLVQRTNPTFVHKPHHKICSLHFESFARHGKWNRLFPGTVPTLHLDDAIENADLTIDENESDMEVEYLDDTNEASEAEFKEEFLEDAAENANLAIDKDMEEEYLVDAGDAAENMNFSNDANEPKLNEEFLEVAFLDNADGNVNLAEISYPSDFDDGNIEPTIVYKMNLTRLFV
jgi:THAP domain